MTLLFDRELMARRFPEIGKPYRMFRDPSGERVAICSSFDHLAWPGRICYENQAVLQRVSLYDSSLQHRIAVLNLAGRCKINDVSFHPVRPELLIGTGDYDGGYFFEGRLLHWDWVSGSCDSLLGESRYVVRCRFDTDGGISVVLLPRHEEEYRDGADTSDLYVVAKIDQPTPMESCYPDPRLEHLQPGNPESAGFTMDPEPCPIVLPGHEMDFLREKGFEERGCIRDLQWLDAETFAVAHDHCHLEIGNIRGHRISRFRGEGHGVELIGTAGDGCLVHVFDPGDRLKYIEARSSLYSYSRGELSPFAAFDHECSFSSDEMGHLLARDVRHTFRRGQCSNDAILRPDGKILFPADLGKFDELNHAFRCHADKLYFLRGTPPESHEHKTLCSVDPEGTIEELTSWDGANWHAMSPLVAILPGGLVRAREIWSPMAPRVSVVERVSFADHSTRWSTELKQGSFTALAASPDHGCVAFAQANGDFGLIDLSSGEILQSSSAAVDGVSTIITSLALHANRLLAGTIDGRILLFGLAD
jgi:hypothetical protein